jgi:hemerythrin-like domain-containing protein
MNPGRAAGGPAGGCDGMFQEVTMNPIEELKNEHRGVEAALRILEGICRNAEIARRIDAGRDIERLLEFFAVFVDTCHHGKEEALLFPALEREGVSRRGGPIGVMLAEHVSGRTHIAEMSRVLAEAQAGRSGAVEDFLRHARGYAELLRQHIFKEESVLFKLAEDLLPEKVKAELVKGFERIEEEKVGPGRHEAFHRMLEELGGIYGDAQGG